jgi:hypothetical protein
MDTDHKLLCLLSKLRSMFPRDFRLGAHGTGSGGKVGHVPEAKLEGRDKTETQIHTELIEKCRLENLPRLVYLWKKYNGVNGLPKEHQERDRVVSNLNREIDNMAFRWLKRQEALKSIWNEIQDEWIERGTTVTRCKANIKKYKEDIKKYQEEIKKCPYQQHKTTTEIIREKDELQKKLTKTEKSLEEDKKTVDNTDTTDPDQYFSHAFVECRKELKRFRLALDNKMKWIHKQTVRETIEKGWSDYNDMEEKLCTLIKIHDDMKRKELDTIRKAIREKTAVARGQITK